MAFLGSFVAEAFEREVTASPAEFERDLRKAWPAGVERIDPDCLRLQDGAIRLEIRVEPNGVRRIGLFALPQLRVHYRFTGGEEADRRRLLARLDRAMQRGGG